MKRGHHSTGAMRRLAPAGLALLLAAGVAAEAAGAEPTGAKGCFFDPHGCVAQSGPAKTPAKEKKAAKRTTMANAAHPGLAYWIELLDEGKQEGARVSPTRVFRAGERIRLHIQPNADGFISILWTQADGTAKRLFPDQRVRAGANAVRALVDNPIPPPPARLLFDDKPEDIRLLVVFAEHPNAGLIAELPRDRDVVAHDVVARGVQEAVNGAKGLLVEVDESGPSPAAYAVMKDSPAPGNPKLLYLEVVLRQR